MRFYEQDELIAGSAAIDARSADRRGAAVDQLRFHVGPGAAREMHALDRIFTSTGGALVRVAADDSYSAAWRIRSCYIDRD